jgi:hypothetical protein
MPEHVTSWLDMVFGLPLIAEWTRSTSSAVSPGFPLAVIDHGDASESFLDPVA